MFYKCVHFCNYPMGCHLIMDIGSTKYFGEELNDIFDIWCIIKRNADSDSNMNSSLTTHPV